MADQTPRAAQVARLATTRDLMGQMSRRGMKGDLHPLPDGTRRLEVRYGAEIVAIASYIVFADARDAGWLIERDDGEAGYILSAVGRAELRRLRSLSEDALPSSAWQGASSELPHHPMARPSHDLTESPLAWLRRRKDKSGEPLISAIQFDAGERLRADLTYAAMGPRVTVNWSAVGGTSGGSGSGLGVDIRDSVSDAQQRVRRALKAVGPMSAGVLIDVCGHLKGLEDVERTRGWPPRSGKVGLAMALSELARHYGLPGSETAPGPRHIRHWGAADYMPLAGGGERPA